MILAFVVRAKSISTVVESYNIKTLSDILHFGEDQFKTAKIYLGHGTCDPWDEAVFLASHVLNLPKDADNSYLSRVLTNVEIKAILQLFSRRIKERIPAPYLINKAWFMGLSFYVDERVLIPRSLTAELIERGFSPFLNKEPKRILDIGTGSGCIAVACALVFKQAKIDAVDISKDALEVAKINVAKYGLADRIRLLESDVFSAVPNETYDIIISNPPYVEEEEFQSLPPEYEHEPHLALAGGVSGLEIVKKILSEAKNHLTPQGLLIVEVGNSKHLIEEYLPKVPFLWLDLECGDDSVFLLTREDM